MAKGEILVEFESEPGRSYEIQYSSDMSDWKAARGTVKAAGNRVQWLDHGPPKTTTHPADSAVRWYRVVPMNGDSAPRTR